MRKSKLRGYQDQMENMGWRIRSIPHDDPSKSMKIDTNWYAIFGVLVMLAGVWLFFRSYNRIYLGLSLCGFVFGFLGIWFVARTNRRGWLRVKAACVDKEIAGGGRHWMFRLLCKFEFEGKAYTVTPHYWRSFGSEQNVQKFLSKVISEDGTCWLHVNPRNPRQTDLIAKDIADQLLR